MSKAFYSEFIREEDAQKGIEAGTLYKGILRVNPKRRKVAYVTVAGIQVDILIDDEKWRNRAFHGDLVVLELFPSSEWAPSASSTNDDTELSIYDQSGDTEVLSRDIQETLWRPKSNLLKPREAETVETSIVLHNVDQVAMDLSCQPRGRVVYILEAHHGTTIIGSIQLPNNIKPKQKFQGDYVYFNPGDMRYPNLMIKRINLPMEYVNDPIGQSKTIYVVDLISSDEWSVESKLCQGINVRSLGQRGSIEAETKALLIQNNVDHGIYTPELQEPLREILGEKLFQQCVSCNDELADAEIQPWEIPPSEILKRRDLRAYRIFTIDPPNAKDLDDALHITPLDDGTYEIGVHIADVSYFLKPGTVLDIEARKRATSVYLVQKVIPMLPSILCEQLCSLNPNVDRLAFSCIWTMHKDGTLTNKPVWYGKTVIRCCAKLDYPTAQRMIDGTIPSSLAAGINAHNYYDQLSEEVWEEARRPKGHCGWDCANDVCLMDMIAKERRKCRLSNGALVLNKGKLNFKLDNDGNPVEFGSYAIYDSNHLVEEYMLLANYLVAEKLIESIGNAAFLRHHPLPKEKGLMELQTLCSRLGLVLDTSSSKSLQQCLRVIGQSNSKVVVDAITSLLTHNMDLAQYIVADNVAPAKWTHYGLAIPYYTHFTSPIRRYADVTVHRLLEYGLMQPIEANQLQYNTAELRDLQFIATNCNEMKNASKGAQTRSSLVFLAVYLMEHPMEVAASVIGIGEKSFTVSIFEYGLEERLFVDEMVSDYTSSYDADAKKIVLTSVNGSKRPLEITLMSKVMVRLTAKDTSPIGVRFNIVGPA